MTQGILVNSCPKGQACQLPFNPFQANGTTLFWNYLGTQQNSLFCGAPNPEPPLMDKAPGDKCNSNSDCHSNKCNLEIRACEATVNLGGACVGNIDCPIGAYCNSQSGQCQVILNEGAACTAQPGQLFGSCGFGRMCFNSTCTRAFSLPVGTNVSMTGNYNMSALCSTAYANTGIYGNQTIYCQPRPKNVLDVMRGYPGPVMCNVSFFLNPMNPTEATNVPFMPAMCGYNQDPNFYCTMWPGDKALSDIIDAQLKLMPGIWNKCSVASIGLDKGGCARILDSTDVEYHRMTQLLDADFINIWPQVANNAPCVKNTITSKFWNNAQQIASGLIAISLLAL